MVANSKEPMWFTNYFVHMKIAGFIRQAALAPHPQRYRVVLLCTKGRFTKGAHEPTSQLIFDTKAAGRKHDNYRSFERPKSFENFRDALH